MKKKLILMLALIAAAVCLFAITANAEQIKGYQQFEVELLDGSVITVYESAAWDQWQGRLNFTDNTYTEPPIDTEKTYPKLDWSQVVVADFTNGHRKQLNTTTGEYVVTYGTNDGYSMHLDVKNFTKANATNLKTIKTGSATFVRGGEILGRFPALEEIIFGEKLKDIGWGAFINNKKLTNIDFSACASFTISGFSVFKGCTSLESVVLPNTLTSIMDNDVFNGCTSLKTVVLSTALTTLPASTFTGCTSLETIGFVGTPSEALTAAVATAAPNATVTSMTVCEAYGHSNMTSLNDCVEQCGVCEAIVEKEIPNHNSTSIIEYTNGYASKGTVTYYCTNEGCTFKTIGEDMNPLFTCLGYSALTSGNGGIVLGFKVHSDAITAYTQATGKTVKYGVFAALKGSLLAKDVFDESGAMTAGVLGAEINTTHTVFEIKVTGIAADKDAKLALGAYVAITDGEATEYSYMQPGTPDENEKYCFVSYNDIAGIPSAGEEVLQ